MGEPRRYLPYYLLGLLIMLLGTRLSHAIVYWYKPNLDILSWSHGGIFFGGMLFAIIYVAVCTRFFFDDNPVLQMFDYMAPSIALALGVAKVGCFLTGCCGGVTTQLPWGVIFPGGTVPVHPLQLYESVFGFAMAGITYRWVIRGGRFPGQIGLTFVMAFTFLRLITWPIREIPPGATHTGLAPLFFIVLLFLLLGQYGYYMQDYAKQQEGDRDCEIAKS